MIKLIVFDFDGTLANSLGTIAHYVNMSLEAFGFSPLPKEKYQDLLGYGSRVLIRGAIERQEEPDLSKEDQVFDYYFENYLKDPARGTEVYPGIEDLIKRLNEDGYKLAVNSNKQDPILQNILGDLFKENSFDFALGQKKGMEAKPHPQGIFEIGNELRVSMEETLYIGDTEVDYETAKNASCKLILVDWGFRTREELKKLKDNIISNTDDLYEEIKNTD